MIDEPAQPHDAFAVYRRLARNVIATAVQDVERGRDNKDTALARNFLNGATRQDRAVLVFWCQVAGIAPHLIQDVARQRWSE